MLALFGALALPATAQAQEIVLVSNIAEGRDSQDSVRSPTYSIGSVELGERRTAQRFTAGPNTAGYVLQSVTLQLWGEDNDAQGVQVAIHENNSSGDPGAQLAVLDNPADPFGVTRTFSAPSPLSFVAGSPYWVVVSNTATTNSSFHVSITESSDQTTTQGFSIRDTRHQGTPGSWSEATDYAVRMEVRGTVAGDTTPPAGICDRTQQVHEAIVDVLSGVDDCAAVTVADLAGITDLTLISKNIDSLKSGDFAGLTSLITLGLVSNSLTMLPADVFSGLTALGRLSLNDNDLESLPADVFSGLTALRTLYLNGNPTNPMPLTVTVEKVGTDQVRAKVLTGAPFAVDIPVTVVDGTLAAGATMLRVAAGAVEGTAVTVTRTAGTTAAVTVDIDLSIQPTLPTSSHRGYAFAKVTTGLPATILPGAADTTPPTLTRASVSGTEITMSLYFSENFDLMHGANLSAMARDAFSLTVGDMERDIGGILR